MNSKIILSNKQDIQYFLDTYATEYDLDIISKKQGIKLYNNIEFNGRVANFLIDIYDIDYFTNILKILHLYDDVSGSITLEYLMNNVIETIIQWIQLRLNTGKIFKHKYWDFLNKLYVQKCFNKSAFKSLYTAGLTDSNIRNIFFGDCREHEILLHILLKLYLKRHNLLSKFKLYRFYGYGTTITNITNNKLFWNKDKLTSINRNVKVSLTKKKSSGGSIYETFPSIEDLSISTWEHTHPLLYDVSSNKLYAIDALGHKTYINDKTVERHNVELKIEKIVNPLDDTTSKYSIWYNNLQDKDTRIYIENPTEFSGSKQWLMPFNSKSDSKLFGNKFDNYKLNNSEYYNKDYFILDLRSISDELFLEDGIRELCLLFKNKKSSSSK